MSGPPRLLKQGIPAEYVRFQNRAARKKAHTSRLPELPDMSGKPSKGQGANLGEIADFFMKTGGTPGRVCKKVLRDHKMWLPTKIQ